MFTGIVQAVRPVQKVVGHKGEWKIYIQRPSFAPWADLKTGDSVAVDGVCLTLENNTPNTLAFHLSFETLNTTAWGIIFRQSLKGKLKTSTNKKGLTPSPLVGQVVNLEPPLRPKDFIGGHFVTGHVDGVAKVIRWELKGDSQLLEVALPLGFETHFWKKAFIGLNGVSLTIHDIKKNHIFLCLVPETLKRTNLKYLKEGQALNFEVDYLARANAHKINLE